MLKCIYKGLQTFHLNMPVTFDPQDLEAGHLNRVWSKLVKWLS